MVGGIWRSEADNWLVHRDLANIITSLHGLKTLQWQTPMNKCTNDLGGRVEIGGRTILFASAVNSIEIWIRLDQRLRDIQPKCVNEAY